MKNMKYKPIEYNPQIYPLKIWIYIGEEKITMFDEDIEELELDEEAATYAVQFKGVGGILIVFRSKDVMTMKTIAHESAHAAIHIFEYIGAEITASAEEPFAYLSGWISGCCEETKEKYGRT